MRKKPAFSLVFSGATPAARADALARALARMKAEGLSDLDASSSTDAVALHFTIAEAVSDTDLEQAGAWAIDKVARSESESWSRLEGGARPWLRIARGHEYTLAFSGGTSAARAEALARAAARLKTDGLRDIDTSSLADTVALRVTITKATRETSFDHAVTFAVGQVKGGAGELGGSIGDGTYVRVQTVRARERGDGPSVAEQRAPAGTVTEDDGARAARKKAIEERAREAREAAGKARPAGPETVDPLHVRSVFWEHLLGAEALTRWELVLPVYLGGYTTDRITIQFVEELGDVRRFFPDTFPAPYAWTAPFHTAPHRTVRVDGHAITLGVGGAREEPTPWDGGVHDALLKTIATELSSYVVGLQMTRDTHSHFEDHDPPRLGASDARAEILRLTAVYAYVQADVDYFREGANPVLELSFRGPDRRFGLCASARGNLTNNLWIPPGNYQVTAFAKVYSQPLAGWTQKNKRFDAILWQSSVLTIELHPGRTYRFAMSLPEERRALTEQEATFIATPEATLERPRELLELRLAEERERT